MSQGRQGTGAGTWSHWDRTPKQQGASGAFRTETNDPSGISGQGIRRWVQGERCRVGWARSSGFDSVILEKGNVLSRKKRDGSERPSRNCTVFSKCCQNGMLEVKIMSTPEKPYPPGGGGDISHKGRPSLTGPAQELGRQSHGSGTARGANSQMRTVWAPRAVTRCS